MAITIADLRATMTIDTANAKNAVNVINETSAAAERMQKAVAVNPSNMGLREASLATQVLQGHLNTLVNEYSTLSRTGATFGVSVDAQKNYALQFGNAIQQANNALREFTALEAKAANIKFSPGDRTQVAAIRDLNNELLRGVSSAAAGANAQAADMARQIQERMTAELAALASKKRAIQANAAAFEASAANEASALGRMTAALANFNAMLRNNAGVWSTLGAGLQSLAPHMLQLSQLSAAASGSIASLLGRLGGLGLVAQSGGGLPMLVAGISAAVTGFGKFFSEAIRVERAIGQVRDLHVMLGRVVGEDGVANYKTLTDVMIKYGLSLEGLSKPIARLKIAAQDTVLGGANFAKFIDDFAAIGSKFALPQEAMAGMAKAFEQMISKGTVQAEEFRQQLGDRLPAAARVGVLAFREMTGNATASFSDFMNAMKNRSIESTRFIAIFNDKMKETFGITNESTNNLATAYGRLGTARDVTISKLDEAVGFTRAWATTLNGVATGITGIGNAASVAGPALMAAFAWMAVPLLGSAGAGIATLATAVGGLTRTLTVLRLVGVAAMAFIGGSYVADAAEKFGLVNKQIENTVRLADGLRNVKFNLRSDVEGEPAVFKDSSVLVAETARYMSAVRAGLREGKKLTLDVDILPNFDKFIAESNAKLKQLGEKLPSSMDPGLRKSYMAMLTSQVIAEQDVVKKAAIAAEAMGRSKIIKEITAEKEKYDRLITMRTNFIALQENLSKLETSRDEALNGGGFIGSIKKAFSEGGSLPPILNGVASALTAIAAVRFTSMLLGINSVIDASGRWASALGKVRGAMILVAAAGAFMLAAGTPAEAAEKGLAGLQERAKQVEEALKRDGDAFRDFGNLGSVLGTAQRQLQTLKTEAERLKEALDVADPKGTERTKPLMNADDVFAKARKGIDDLLGANAIQAPNELQVRLESIKKSMEELNGVITRLAPVQQKFNQEIADSTKGLEQGDKEADRYKKAFESIHDTIDTTTNKLEILRTRGLAGLKEEEGVLTILKSYATGITSVREAAESADPALRKLAEDAKKQYALQNTLAEARKKIEEDAKKNKTLNAGGDYSQAIARIEQAEAMMEGFGSKTGAAMKKATDDVRKYQEALIAVGVATDEAAVKAAEYRAALEMQIQGLNFASLQFKPLQAAQRSMEAFADSFAELVAKGDLNAKSFKQTISNMAISFTKDMLSMAIKANLVRPLLAGLFGTGLMNDQTQSLKGGNGIGGLLDMLPKFAKGDVFDSPTMFGMGNGGAGILGEAGPEAVMPLTRTSNGGLGVVATGGGGKSAGDTNMTVNFNMYGTVGASDLDNFKKDMPGIILGVVRNAQRRGNI